MRDDEGDLEFHELPEPSPQQVSEVAARTANRIVALLKKAEPHAVVKGINVHAAVAFDARDKPRMERMCRYLARPPIAQNRLSLRDDGSVQYTMKKTWRDGTRAIVLQPLDLIHWTSSRPQKEVKTLAKQSAAELGDAVQTDLFDDVPNKPKRNPWAWLIKKVFLIDVTECPDCGGRMNSMEACTARRDPALVASEDYSSARSSAARVIRGGCWSDDFESSRRAGSAPSFRRGGLGFRCAG